MTKHVLSLLLLVFLALPAFSQSYVVTREGDTLRGKVNVFQNNQKVEILKFKQGKERKTFQVTEVAGYSDTKGKIYHTIYINGKYRFAQLQRKGYVSIYRYTSDRGTSNSYLGQVAIVRVDGNSMDVPGLVGF